jgi:AraC-like DNA-binding protein
MEYQIAKPSTALAKFIKHYWALDNCIPYGSEHTQRIIPNGLIELIFYLDKKPVSTDSSKQITDTSTITGHLNEYYDIKVSGNLSLFSIIFKPFGLSAFLDIPCNEIYNRNIPLRFLLKNSVSEIENRLFEAKTFAQRVEIAEGFLLNLLKQKNSNYHFKRIESSFEIINSACNDVSIDTLASNACFSRKQFERIFVQVVGSSPKKFLKTVRFQRAIHLKSRSEKLSFAELAYLCRYYDQAHMTNDFTKFSGLTPKEFFRGCDSFSDYFQ